MRSLVLAIPLVAVACTLQQVSRTSGATASDDHMSHMNSADLVAPRVTSRSQQQGTAGIP
ncbi:MAG: hypothetical protein JNL26_00350, partial [Gemmatimonadetes bacterium]|nr:hypothetical protein [Gemmatimonadota bacterium]